MGVTTMPPTYVSLKVHERQKEIYFEEKWHVLRSMQDKSAFLLHIYSCLLLVYELVRVYYGHSEALKNTGS